VDWLTTITEKNNLKEFFAYWLENHLECWKKNNFPVLILKPNTVNGRPLVSVMPVNL
jgi:hypothetical protein